MTQYTNEQIAADLNLWNEYFNTSGLMTDSEFAEMAYEIRLALLDDAFPESTHD